MALPARRADPVIFRDAIIIFRNFAGREGMYNQEGERSFHLVLDPDTAVRMREDGWNVKQLKSREEGVEGDYHIEVSVSYKKRPPRVCIITHKGRTDLPEEMVEILDWVDIGKVDLHINPYSWLVNGRGGIKAYLKAIFLTVAESELDIEYNAIPEAQAPTIRELPAGPSDDDVIDVESWEDDEPVPVALPSRSGRTSE